MRTIAREIVGCLRLVDTGGAMVSVREGKKKGSHGLRTRQRMAVAVPASVFSSRLLSRLLP